VFAVLGWAHAHARRRAGAGAADEVQARIGIARRAHAGRRRRQAGLAGGGELLAGAGGRIAVDVAEGVVALEEERQLRLAAVHGVGALVAELGAQVALVVVARAVELGHQRITILVGVADLFLLLEGLAHTGAGRELVEDAARAVDALEGELALLADGGGAGEDVGAGVEVHRRQRRRLARRGVAR